MSLPARAQLRPSAQAWLPWLVWGLGGASYCFGFFQRVAPSVMIDSLMRDLAVGGAILGNLSAIYFYAYGGLQIPIGLMLDRWGPRRMLSLGMLLCALGSLIFATAEAMPQAYLGRLLIGGGAGFAFVGTLTLATHWFPPQRFGRLSGLTLVCGMAGGVAGQAPLAALVDWTGWRAVLFGAGLFGLLLAAAVWLVVRDRAAGGDGARHATGGATPFFLALARVAMTRTNLLTALVGAAMTAPILSFAGLWGVAWLMQSYGLPRPSAAGIASLLLAGWGLGAPFVGYLSDRVGRRRPLLAAGSGAGLVLLAALLYLPALPHVALSLLFFATGLALGAMVLCFPVAREANPPELTGTALGFVNFAIIASSAVFQPVIGWLLDLKWDGRLEAGARVYADGAYHFAFAVLLVLLALGLLGALALPRMAQNQADGSR